MPMNDDTIEGNAEAFDPDAENDDAVATVSALRSLTSRLDDIEEMVEGDRQSTKDQFAEVRRQLAELRKLFAGEGPA